MKNTEPLKSLILCKKLTLKLNGSKLEFCYKSKLSFNFSINFELVSTRTFKGEYLLRFAKAQN